MNLKIGFLACWMALLSVSASFADGTMICSFEKFTSVEAEYGRLSNGTSMDTISVIFTNLNTSAPLIRANATEVNLQVLKRTSNSIYMTEETPEGNLNFWTVFPQAKVAIYSKQYLFGDTPFGTMGIGKCE